MTVDVPTDRELRQIELLRQAPRLRGATGGWHLMAEDCRSVLVVVENNGSVRTATARRHGTSLDITQPDSLHTQSLSTAGFMSDILMRHLDLPHTSGQGADGRISRTAADDNFSDDTLRLRSAALQLHGMAASRHGDVSFKISMRYVQRSVLSVGPGTPVRTDTTNVLTTTIRALDRLSQRRSVPAVRRLAWACRPTDVDSGPIAAAAANAAAAAREYRQSRPAPVGPKTIVFGGSSGGTLIHEACGHCLEADAVYLGGSVLSRKLGSVVNSVGLTVVDDSVKSGLVASSSFDDEGTDGQRSILVDDGELVGVVSDRFHSQVFGCPMTGNGRRQSYSHSIQPRMSNIYVEPGTDDPVDLISDVSDGLYVVALDGGEVTMASGSFALGCHEAYRILNGRVQEPVDQCTILGDAVSLLRDIDGVGPTVEHHHAVCGKAGQRVHITDGSPALRVRRLLVGGAEL